MLAYNQKYIDFDTETEGLNLKYSRPWELSFLLAEGKRVVSKQQLYIDIPNLNLTPLVKKLTGFNQEKYDRIKKPPTEVLEIIKEYIYNEEYILVGQNILKFDIWMLKILFDMCGEEIDFSFRNRILDTRFLAVADLNNIEKPRNGSLLDWQVKLSNDDKLKRRGVSQLALLKKFGIPFEEHKLHDGLYDVERNWEIFLELKDILKL